MRTDYAGVEGGGDGGAEVGGGRCAPVPKKTGKKSARSDPITRTGRMNGAKITVNKGRWDERMGLGDSHIGDCLSLSGWCKARMPLEV